MNEQQRTTAGPGRGKSPGSAFAWALLLFGALTLCLLAGSFVPFFPWLWWLVPTLALLFVAFAAAAPFARINRWAGVLAGIVGLAAFGAAGAWLRQQSSAKWTALAAQDTLSIERRLGVPLLNPVAVSGDVPFESIRNVKYVYFSPELYDSIDWSCPGEFICVKFGGFEPDRSVVSEEIEDALAGVRLRVADADSVIALHLTQSSQDGVITIQAALRDARGTSATMRIFRPDPARKWSSTIPKPLYLMLQDNPLSVMLSPDRPRARKTPVQDFLQQAIQVAAAGTGPEKSLTPRVLSSTKLDASRRFSQDSAEAEATLGRRPIDPACLEHVTLVPGPPGRAVEGYLALARSSVRIPVPAFSQVICRGEHVYVLRGIGTFHRYALDGTALGTYHVYVPEELNRLRASYWRVDLDSIEEDGNTLNYAMDGYHREWVDTPPRHDEFIHQYRQIWQIPL
jgi:hypothetical protein